MKWVIMVSDDIRSRREGIGGHSLSIRLPKIMPPLLWKNTYRLARSLHFSNADDAEVQRTLRLIEQQMEESDHEECLETSHDSENLVDIPFHGCEDRLRP